MLKPLREERDKVAAVPALGINTNFPRILTRSLLYSQIARAGGIFKDFVPEITFGHARLTPNDEPEMVQMIEKVGGAKPRTGRQWLKDRKQPLTRAEKGAIARDLTRLQYLDHLLTQVDRHYGNYIVETDVNGRVIGLKPIDNDYSLASKEVKGAISINVEDPIPAVTGILQFKLPDVADQSTQQFFAQLTPEDIPELANNGLTDAQIEIINSRLQEIKSHLKQLEHDKKIIDDRSWKANYTKVKTISTPDDTFRNPENMTYFDALRISDKDGHVFGEDKVSYPNPAASKQ